MKILIGKCEGTIYPEGSGYTGAIDLGADGKGGRNRLKRKARTNWLPSANHPPTTAWS